MTDTKTLDLWNKRAGLGSSAGTQDRHAVMLERRIILSQIQAGMRVLDVGCGTGETLSLLPPSVQAVGLDFSPVMVQAAQTRNPHASIHRADVASGDFGVGLYDVVYTQRCLINLAGFALQAQAIRRCCALLAPGGCYLAVENSQTGLTALNVHRVAAGLPPIVPPWHNRYLDDAAVAALYMDGCELEAAAVDYSSTYYYLSRVINAWQAHSVGYSPNYDAPLNQLATTLPVMGNVGQGRYWRWRTRS